VTHEEIQRRLLAIHAVESVECRPVAYTAVMIRMKHGATVEDRGLVFGAEMLIQDAAAEGELFDFLIRE
jgi:predicted metal-dependent hydrolase